jgi:hypothetical protein
MRHAVPFAQVLDEAVSAADAASTIPRPSSASALPRAIGFFEFTVRGAQPPRIVSSNRSTYQIVAEPQVDARFPNTSSQTFDSWKNTRSFSTVRSKRHLTRAQRQAVEEMASLGVCLTADFSDDEVRGAYRQLARRYHPDRHPACSEGEKARLGALFARAHASYQVLLQHSA